MGRISMPIGRGHLTHNRRDFDRAKTPWPDNIDKSRSSENITLIDKSLKATYEEIFGEAYRDWCDDQIKHSHPERAIHDTYYSKILSSDKGEKAMYEDVVQWGTMDDYKAHPELRDKAKAALIKYVETWPERNPQLHVIGAYIHMDEASPHLHLDYIPVARYSKGQRVRNSCTKALQQQGITVEGRTSKTNNVQVRWKDQERAYIAELCREQGLVVDEERKSDRQYLSVTEYGEAKDRMIGEIQETKATLETQVRELNQQIEDDKAIVKDVDKLLPQWSNAWGGKKVSEAEANRVDQVLQAAGRAEARCQVAYQERIEAKEREIEAQVESRVEEATKERVETLNQAIERAKAGQAGLAAGWQQFNAAKSDWEAQKAEERNALDAERNAQAKELEAKRKAADREIEAKKSDADKDIRAKYGTAKEAEDSIRIQCEMLSERDREIKRLKETNKTLTAERDDAVKRESVLLGYVRNTFFRSEFAGMWDDFVEGYNKAIERAKAGIEHIIGWSPSKRSRVH